MSDFKSITKNKEDYLNEIYRLQTSKNGAIKSVELAKALKVSKPSVSEMLKKLSKEDLIATSGKKDITLTKKGIENARKINRKHRILEVFFKDVLNLKDKFHEEAHKIEHALSDEACNRLELFLNNPSICPDGNPIPSRESDILTLDNLDKGVKAKILFSSENNKDEIERMNVLGISPNSFVKIIKKTEKSILSESGKKIFRIEKDAASKIFVEMG